MADGGKVRAFCEGAQETVAEIAENSASKAAGFGEETAQKVRDSVSLHGNVDDAARDASKGIGGHDGYSGLPGSGSASGGGPSDVGEPGQGLGAAADRGPSAAQGRGELPAVGDPVDVATGDVVFAQADVGLGGALPLVLERVHRSSHRTGRWLGRSWMSSFDQRLEISGDRVTGAFADGRVLTWPRPAPGDDGTDDGSGSVLPVTGPSWRLRRADDGAWTVTDPRLGWTWRFERRRGHRWSEADGGQGELPLVSVADRAGARDRLRLRRRRRADGRDPHRRVPGRRHRFR